MEKSTSPKVTGGISERLLAPVLLAFLLLSLAGNGYLVIKVKKLSADPQLVAKQEVVDLIREVGRLIVLPQGEEPTIATVTDPEQLKSQAFFASAERGYKVLLYATAKKAILYDPINKKIIEVAPINIGAPTGETPGTTPVAP
ncbi:MAG: hypothetical protein WC813_03230 [Patescibacteria group bacterium]